MSINFFDSRSGVLTCSWNGINLHSSYDPVKEAQRFVQGISFDFVPKAIIVTFPCLSYCAKFIKEKFPGAIVCAVQPSDIFSKYDSEWDKTFIVSENLSDELYDYLGDEVLISTLFVSWQPAEKTFPDEFNITWKGLKNAVLKSRNILNTRSYFSKRWIKNSFRFFKFLNNQAEISCGNKDIIVCASGPSLLTSIPYLKKHREELFVIAVSSALSPLVENNIIPELVVSTDGGYWAKEHLSFHLQYHPEICLALPFEAAAFAWNFNNPVIPLSYGDGPSEALIKESKIFHYNASRNGTVSGTSALFALNLTSGNVYFCGLDLAPNKNYAHTQPNELELRDSLADNRLKTKETRITPQSFNSPSLEIYKNWFSSYNFKGRLFRLSDNYNYSNKLTNVPDVNWTYFEKHFNKNKINPKLTVKNASRNKEEKIKIAERTVHKYYDSPEWLNNAFPVEYVLLERKRNTPEEKDLSEDINSKMQIFTCNLLKSIKGR